MYSLRNVFAGEEGKISDLHKNVAKQFDCEEPIAFWCEPKIDGVAICLWYEDGVLVRALTRGDGMEGEDVSANVRVIKDIPHQLRGTSPSFLEVRGESYMPLSAFAALRETESGAHFVNPRNATAGSLRQKESGAQAQRVLRFISYGVGEVSTSVDTQETLMASLRAWGLPVSAHGQLCTGVQECIAHYKALQEHRTELDFEADGTVLKLNRRDWQLQMGETSHSPRWAVAYKFPSEESTTVLLDVDFQVGRTGVITPVAQLEPVYISGAVVKRASLHNADHIEQLGLYIGARVVIKRSGDVIPKIIAVAQDAPRDHANGHATVPSKESKHKPIVFPAHCPECSDTLINKNNLLYCTKGASCPGQVRTALLHFVSRGAMNIQGMGDSWVALLTRGVPEAGIAPLVHTVADIYDLKRAGLYRVWRAKNPSQQEQHNAPKHINNLLAAIEESRRVPLANFLYALGIEKVGMVASTKLAEYFGTLDAVLVADESTLKRALETEGSVSASSISDFLNDDHWRSVLERLRTCLEIAEQQPRHQTAEGPLAAEYIVFTGTLEHCTRMEAHERVRALGARVGTQIGATTTAVVLGKNAGASKIERIKKFNTAQYTEAEWLEWMEQCNRNV